jgi:hypothetical protein
MRLLLPIALLSLSACATSVEGLGEDEIDLTLTSTRPAEEVASCLAMKLLGDNNLLRVNADHFVVTRKNGYGFPIIRWDMKNSPTGSTLELRTSTPVGEGVDKARECAAA